MFEIVVVGKAVKDDETFTNSVANGLNAFVNSFIFNILSKSNFGSPL